MAAATVAVGGRNLGPDYGAQRSSDQNSDEWNFSVPDPLGVCTLLYPCFTFLLFSERSILRIEACVFI